MHIANTQKGFTIVETLIVLAIASLILMIILMAIPTLQRNGRNNERKQDVASMLQSVSSWGLNNSGEFPAASAKGAMLERTKRTIYTDADTITLPDPARSSESYASPAVSVGDGDSVIIMNYAKCSNGQAIGQGAGYNDIVAVFALETRTGFTPQCQQL